MDRRCSPGVHSRTQAGKVAAFCVLLGFPGLLGADSANLRTLSRLGLSTSFPRQSISLSLHKMSDMYRAICCQVPLNFITVFLFCSCNNIKNKSIFLDMLLSLWVWSSFQLNQVVILMVIEDADKIDLRSIEEDETGPLN